MQRSSEDTQHTGAHPGLQKTPSLGSAPPDVYHLVWDSRQVERFMQQFLTKGSPGCAHVTMVQLMARRKYDARPEIERMRVGTLCVARLFLAGETGHVGDGVAGAVRAVQRLQVPLGCYVDKDGATPLPPDVLVAYAHIVPRDVMSAVATTHGETTHALARQLGGGAPPVLDKHPWNALRHHLARTPAAGSRALRHLDVDTKDPAHLARLAAVLRDHGIVPEAVIETRGGFHVVYNHGALSKAAHAALYALHMASALTSAPRGAGDYWLGLSKGENVGIPGMLQAGSFRVRFVDAAPACWLAPQGD